MDDKQTLIALQRRLLGLMVGIVLISLISNVLLYNHFTQRRPLVSIGSTVITKGQYFDALEGAAGKQVLNKMVYAELVRQAATRSGIMPTNPQVTAQMAHLRAQNMAPYGGLPDDELRADVTSLLALDNLRLQNVTVTDADIFAYYARHIAALRQAPQTRAMLCVTGSPADAQTAAQLLQVHTDPAVIAEQPGFQVVGVKGYFLNLRTPERQGIVHAILAMKGGAVRIFPLGQQFLTVEVYVSRPASVPPLWRVKNHVAHLARLEKAPTVKAELAALYHASPPTFEIDKYAYDFQDNDYPVH